MGTMNHMDFDHWKAGTDVFAMAEGLGHDFYVF
jgi:hypothetical protein